MVEQPPAGRGEACAAPVSMEQVRPKLYFKGADLPAYCGLCDIQQQSRAAEALLLCHIHEITQLYQFHG